MYKGNFSEIETKLEGTSEPINKTNNGLKETICKRGNFRKSKEMKRFQFQLGCQRS